jgi:hypothetical protein
MSRSEKSNPKSLKQACWAVGATVTAVCVELGISRQTAYDAWANPALVPLAAQKLFARLKLNENQTAKSSR